MAGEKSKVVCRGTSRGALNNWANDLVDWMPIAPLLVPSIQEELLLAMYICHLAICCWSCVIMTMDNVKRRDILLLRCTYVVTAHGCASDPVSILLCVVFDDVCAVVSSGTMLRRAVLSIGCSNKIWRADQVSIWIMMKQEEEWGGEKGDLVEAIVVFGSVQGSLRGWEWPLSIFKDLISHCVKLLRQDCPKMLSFE